MRGVVLAGMATIVAALAPVTLGRYDLTEHQVLALSSVLVLVSYAVLMSIHRRTPEYRVVATTLSRRPRLLEVSESVAYLLVVGGPLLALVVIALGLLRSSRRRSTSRSLRSSWSRPRGPSCGWFLHGATPRYASGSSDRHRGSGPTLVIARRPNDRARRWWPSPLVRRRCAGDGPPGARPPTMGATHLEVHMAAPNPDIPLLAALPSKDRARILSYLKQRSFEPGQVVIREGDQGLNLFIVISGRARVERDGVVTASNIGPGDFFGSSR